jgi:uncharacterized membrane protein
MSLYQLVLVLFLAVVIAAALYLFVPTGRSRTRSRSSADPQYTGPMDRDNDRYWLAGIIYYNPDDSEPFVPKRYGWGWTVNIGHIGGKVVLIVMVLMVLLPVLLVLAGVHLPSVGCHPSSCHDLP